MESLVAAQVWHYWISIPLALLSVVAVVATVFGYLKRVVEPRYPRQ